MAKFRFEKIVRDKIPQMLEAQNINFIQKKLSHPEIIAALKEKLLEEAEEAKEAQAPQDLCEEIADVMEVLESLLAQSQITWEDVDQARSKKNQPKGAFQNAVYITTVEGEDGHPLESYYRENPLKYPRLHTTQKGSVEMTLHESAFLPVDRELLNRLRRFNDPHFGTERAKYFTLAAHEGNLLIGGVSGFTKQGLCFLNVFYVDETHRYKGLGKEFLKIIENHAQSHHCTKIDLETFEFQGLEFYKKLGFQVIKTVEKFLSGHTMYFMRKNLEDM